MRREFRFDLRSFPPSPTEEDYTCQTDPDHRQGGRLGSRSRGSRVPNAIRPDIGGWIERLPGSVRTRTEAAIRTRNRNVRGAESDWKDAGYFLSGIIVNR